jgi:mRNA interferase RelE/StbE
MSVTEYAVLLTNSAQKEIKNLDNVILGRVLAALRLLRTNPRPPGCRKLAGQYNRWRIRIGDYRIVYKISDTTRTVEVIAARHRSKAYE